MTEAWEFAAWGAIGTLAVVALFAGSRLPVRIAVRNLRRRTLRVAIVTAGLMIGTAIISSSLVVGDTLRFIFVEDVYERLGAVDELVTQEFGGNLFSFGYDNYTVLRADLEAANSPIDGIAPSLVKVLPVRNLAGNKGNQQITALGIDTALESGFGDLRNLNGTVVTTSSLGAGEVYLNVRVRDELNATWGSVLTMFYGTTSTSIFDVVVRDFVRNEGTANYERAPIVVMGLADAQRSFAEDGQINLIRISNVGGVAEGVVHTDEVSKDVAIAIASHRWPLSVGTVKEDGIRQAESFGEEASELFLIMGTFAILAGLLLIVNIFVMLAEERKVEMGVSRALGMPRSGLVRSFLVEGSVYAVLAAALGAAAGLGLGWVMISIFALVVNTDPGIAVTFHYEPDSVTLALLAGLAMTLATVFLASWLASRLNIVRAIRDLPPPPRDGTGWAPVAVGGLVAAGGAAAILLGFVEDVAIGRVAGIPILLFGLAVGVSARTSARWPLTAASLGTMAWLLAPISVVDLQGDDIPLIFVTTGVLLVLSGILLAVFHASEVLRGILRRLPGSRGHPVARAAVSYPMEKRFRTAMTLAMFALILFMVTIIGMVQGLQASSLDRFVQQQSGGYDIVAYRTSYGEIPDFRGIIRDNLTFDPFLGGERGVSSASVVPVKVSRVGGNGSFDYTLWGVDNFLVETNQYAFVEHLPSVVDDNGTVRELRTREDVWHALAWNRSYAVVDRSAAGSNQFVPGTTGLRVAPGDTVRAFNGRGAEVNLTVLGILEQALAFTSGVFADQDVVKANFPANETYTAYFFQVAPGIDVGWLRSELERVFFAYGLQTIDIREEIGQAFELSNRVLFLMQAYLGIGLLVGSAGLAVLTARTVVERRQAIGTLRAIGFTRSMVLKAFLLEVLFVACLGTLVGIGLGVVFAYKVWLVYFADFAVFSIPWLNLASVLGVTLVVALLATASPARRASRIPPAEALRAYE